MLTTETFEYTQKKIRKVHWSVPKILISATALATATSNTSLNPMLCPKFWPIKCFGSRGQLLVSQIFQSDSYKKNQSKKKREQKLVDSRFQWKMKYDISHYKLAKFTSLLESAGRASVIN